MSRQLWSAAALAALLVACNPRSVSEPGDDPSTGGDCVRCHGGVDNQTGAPPRAVAGDTATTSLHVGAHSAHLAGGRHLAPALGCDGCHVAPDPANLGAHVDGRTEIRFGALGSTGGVAAAWDRTAETCTVYCHGASLSGGEGAPVWTRVDGTQGDCGSCHGAPPPAPHPQSSDCARCHPGSIVDTGGAPATPTANHLNGQIEFAGGCSTCHGNPDRATTVELVKAAPPIGLDGETATTARAVGAHEAHLLGGDLALPVPCESCHVVPTETTHFDGTVDRRFAGVAIANGTEATFGEADPANPTCTNWCHGAPFPGRSVSAPVWTRVNGTQDACGACHGAPPSTLRSGAPHPAGTDCGMCHPGTVDRTTGRIRVSNGMHVNGVVEVEDFHPAGWLTPPSGPDDPDWHGYAANRDLASCKACHGDDFSGGGTGVSCNACHAASGHASWTSECTFCHGDGNRSAFQPAPPVGTQGEVAASTRAVGAHQKHLVGGAYRAGMLCTECHTVPTDVGHVSGTVDLAFGPLATAHGATPAIGADGRCSSTYCHGATLAIGGGSNETPLWTGGPAEAVCSTCHGIPPPAPHPQLSTCASCHDETMLNDTTIDVASGTHVDGVVQHTAYHPPGWVNPAVHGLAANADLASCRGCHGADLSGGASGVACASCHGATWQSNCTFCHGQRLASYTPGDLPRAAPPEGTQNETATTARAVGAHARHLQGGAVSNAFACEECHAVPADLGHVNGVRALAFGAIANADSVVSSFTGATCTTYCHGASLADGTNRTPAWTTVDGTQAACGTCHGLPPATISGGAPHPQNPSCGSCHPGFGPTTVDRAVHVNGTINVVLTCSSCHGDPTRIGTEQRQAAPPVGTMGETASTTLAVGAHERHLNGGALSRAMACTECHVVPTSMSHPDGTRQIVFGALATTGSAPTSWIRASATCTNYCHGSTLPGGTNGDPDWRGGSAEAACGSCHGAPPPAPHPRNTSCGSCHEGYTGTTVNLALHVNGTTDVAPLSCTSCHGEPGRAGDETRKAAPPVGTGGESATTDIPVGAHERHLAGGTIARAIACAECHVVPPTSDVASPVLHANGEVAFGWGSLATGGDTTTPTWTRATATCSSTYCHGATLDGGGIPAPVWTNGPSETTCGACHGTPPTTVRNGGALHPAGNQCGVCHPGTVDPVTGELLVANGLHVNGVVDVQDVHPAGWLELPSGPNDPDWHGYAANRDLASCQACHGADFGGGPTGISCNACHAANGFAAWTTTCTFCHGDVARPAFQAAPPVGTQGELAASDRAVGAHQRHLAGGAIRSSMVCTECHAVPTDVGHVTGTVDMTWGPLASAGGATPAVGADGRCSSTYCHGATLGLGGGTNETPLWTGGAGEAACGSCHGAPPPSPHPQISTCASCHDATMLNDTTIDLASGTHVDGVVQRTGYHPNGWESPAVHGLAANADLSSCRGCHGDDLSGGASGVACASCHGATWQSNCTFCHGARVPNGSYVPALLNQAAPPEGTQNETATTARAVGAHARHLQGGNVSNPFVCTECHAVPADLGHVNGVRALAFGTIANADGVSSLFSGTSCATYCHGASLAGGTNRTPAWTTVNGTQAACGSCHGLPPATTSSGAPHSPNPNCGGCHEGYTQNSVNRALHVNGRPDVMAFTCFSCHGDPLRAGSDTLKASPPVGSAGETATTTRAVGAHQRHLQGGALSSAVACTECHVVPTSMAHSDVTVQLTWGPLARADGASPQWTLATTTCSSTYCHGATLLPGGANTAPDWTAGAGETACGSCHGLPPGGGHPTNPNCGGCHGAGYSATTVNPATHVNGVVNVEAFSCASCHGDGARTGTDYVKAAPPVGSRGETAESTLAVGAHAAHVYSPTLTNGYACTECHVAPPLTDVGPPALHANGTVAMQFGTIANQGGTSTTWNRAAATCSASYCHGAFAGGQLTNAPNWTLGDSQATCGSCHGAPPPAPHPQSTACGGCHPGFGPGTVDRNVHANGALNVSLTCSSCHGDPARAGTDQRKAAPPAGTNGETAPTTLAVGAHARHLDGGALSRAIACTECHVVPTSMGHPDGTRQITFGALATTGSAPTSWVRTAATCTNYCHGSTLPGGTNRDPDWRGGAPEAVCGSCHGAPPPSPHSQNPNCGGCHDGYTSASVNLATHVDGHLDLRADFSCSSCHGDSSRVGSDLLKAAPPAGTAGETSTTQLAVGAHQVHLTDGGLANAMACTSCHAVPTSLAHPDGTAQIQWGGLATQGGAAPVWDRTTGTCSNTYCHGNYSGTHHYDVYDFGSDTLTPMTYDYAGSNATPTWTAGAACGSCHGSPPTNSESGSWHGFHGGGNQCQLCHPDATGLPGSATISNPALHVNGVVELAPRWQNSCFDCH